MMDYKKEYINLATKYEELHNKLYEKDFFEVEPASEYTEDSRQFKNGLCVFNNRLGMAYSVTEIVEVLNGLHEMQDLILEIFDARIEALENDLERAIDDGMPVAILYDELEDLQTLRNDIKKILRG